MEMVSVNWIAVSVCVVIAMATGALWYSPLLFGNIWMELSDITEDDVEKTKEKGMWKSYFFEFSGAFLMSYVSANFVKYSGAETYAEGSMVGFWAWLGFIVPVLSGSVLWENKPVKLYLFNIGYYLVVLIIIGAILAVWK